MSSRMRLLRLGLVVLGALYLSMQLWANHHLDLAYQTTPTFQRNFPAPPSGRSVIRLASSSGAGISSTPVSAETIIRLDEPILQELRRARVNVTSLPQEMLQSIPTWKQITKSLGETIPHVLGLETCEGFQASVQDGKRFIGVSGMFNSGTNVLAYLLEENCSLDVRGRVLWQVPWGKHSRASRRDIQTVDDYEKFNKTLVLATVVTRSPYDVLESMCRNSYSVHYPNDANSTCPHMVDHTTGEMLSIGVGGKRPGTPYPSIAHFWNRWYQEYVQFPYPRLIVRLEDLTVRPQATIEAICTCAGGTMEKEFSYAIKSVKQGMGHGKASESNGLIEAWARLGRAVPFPQEDYEAAKEHLNGTLLEAFHYQHPERRVY